LNDNPIGIFDSGIGGLTVVKEILRLMPNERIIYFGDTARVPYGSKSPKAVREFAMQDASFLFNKGVKTIVIACNTASAEALDLLQNEFGISVIGVIEPGARAASLITSGNVGVIGTHGTIASGAYRIALHNTNSSINVESIACPLLVPLIEEDWIGKSATKEIADEYLKPLLEKNIDTLILGCTHYPVLKSVLQEVVGAKVTLIDSAEATADELVNVLDKNGLETSSTQKDKPVNKYYVSDFPFRFKEMAERFLGEELSEVELVSLEEIESSVKS